MTARSIRARPRIDRLASAIVEALDLNERIATPEELADIITAHFHAENVHITPRKKSSLTVEDRKSTELTEWIEAHPDICAGKTRAYCASIRHYYVQTDSAVKIRLRARGFENDEITPEMIEEERRRYAESPRRRKPLKSDEVAT